MNIRQAHAKDVLQLDRLLASHSVGSKYGLQMCCHPDPALLLLQPEDHIVLLGETGTGQVVASFTAIRKIFVFQGQNHRVYQLDNPVIDPEFYNDLLPLLLFRKMHQELIKRNADLLICENENGLIQSLPRFGAREGILPFLKLPASLEYLILPRCTSDEMKSLLVVANFDHLPLRPFYENFYQPRCFFESMNSLDGCTHFTSSHEKEIKAAITLCDGHFLRQKLYLYNQVAPGLIPAVLRAITNLLYVSTVPRRGRAYRMLYVHHFGYAPQHEPTLAILLKYAMEYAWETGHELMSMTIRDDDQPLKNLLKPFGRMVFRSEKIISSMQGNADLLNEIISQVSGNSVQDHQQKIYAH